MSERCRWLRDADVPGGRFFVPGCMARAVNIDAKCTCKKSSQSSPRDKLAEFRQRVAELEAKIEGRA